MDSRNIYEQQSVNRRNTLVVMVLFTLFLGFLGLGFDVFFLGFGSGGFEMPIGTIAALIIGSVSAYRSLESGASTVLSSSGAVPVPDNDPKYQVLRNVVEEMAIASGSPKPNRIQNAFISTDEVERVTNHIGRQKGYSAPFKLPSVLEKKRQAGASANVSEDELFDEAAHIVVRHQQGSVSLLQRRLKVGYSRAARMIDELEAAGIVGQFDGSKAREVLVETEAELEVLLKSL